MKMRYRNKLFIVLLLLIVVKSVRSSVPEVPQTTSKPYLRGPCSPVRPRNAACPCLLK